MSASAPPAPRVRIHGSLQDSWGLTEALARLDVILEDTDADVAGGMPPDLILVAVPGEEVVARVSELAGSRGTRVVPLLEPRELGLVAELAAAGAADFLAVPADAGDLEARLRMNLRRPAFVDPDVAVRLELAAKSTGTGLWDWEVQTGRLVLDERWARIVGYTLAELAPVDIGVWRRLCHPEDLARSEALLEEHFQGRAERYECEVRLLHRDGHWVWVLDRGQVVQRSADGTPLRMTGTHVDLTTWRAAQERDELFRIVAESSGDPMLVADRDGKIIDCNRAASEFLGYTREELVTLTLAHVDVDLGERSAGPEDHHGRILPGESALVQTLHRTKGGRIVPVEVRVTPVHVHGEQAYVGFVRDLSRRKRREAVLEAHAHLSGQSAHLSSRDLLRIFLDHAEILTGSTIGFFHFVDDDQEHIHLQEWSSNTTATMCHADGSGLHYPISEAGVWVDCMHTRAPVIHNDYASLPHRRGLPEGHAPVTRELVVPVIQDDKVVAILGVGNKLTDYDEDDALTLTELAREGWEVVLRRQAEERAHQESARYRGVVGTSPDGFWSASMDGSILDVNDSYCQLVGYTREEILGIKVWELTDRSAEAVRKLISQIPEQGTVRFDSVHRRKDGTPVEVDVHARYVDTDGGRIYAFIRDASERIRLLDEVRRSQDDYAALVENSPDVIMRFDEEGRHLFVSGRVSDWGLPDPEAFLGRTHREMGFPEEACEEWEDRIRRAADGETLESETTLEGPDGTRYLNWRLIPEGVDAEGKRTVLSLSRDVTEQRRLARDYQSLFEAMLDGFALHEIITDAAGEPVDYRFLAVNPAFEALTGLRAAEVVGRTVKEIMPGTEDSWIKRYGDVALTGEPISFEDVSEELGKVFSVTAYCPAPRQFAVIFVDVTEQRRLAADYHGLFTRMGEGVGVCELIRDASGEPVDYRFLSANPAMARILRRDLEEVVGARITAVLAPEDVRSVPVFGEVVTTGEPAYTERYVASIDRFVTVSAQRAGPDQFTLVVTDISARRRAEVALRESEARLRGVFDHAPVGIFLVDQAGVVLAVNPAFAEMLHRSPDDMVGTSWESFTHPDHVDGCRTLVAEVLSGGARTRELEKRYLKADGEEVWARARVAPIRNDAGDVDFLSVLVEDLTQARLAAAQREEMESRLRQAQKMEAIGTLAGGIAHDFNNILGAILGYAELAGEDLGDPDLAAKDIAEVMKAGNRAKDLVSQILAFSRQGEQERRPLRLAPIVKEAVKLLRASIPSTIEIRTDVRGDSGTVMADATQVHQVLMNLCTNAYHAMRERGGTLDVRLRFERITGAQAKKIPDLRAGDYAVMEVEDSGPGIPAEILGHIFEPYFTTKEQGEGTGLGLAIVHGIVLSHGGAIQAWSVPGEGARFRVYFPSRADQGEEEGVPAARLKPRGTERVLFVDDERAICEIAEEGLSRLGYDVLATVDPHNALELVRKDPRRFDVVITDLTMPRFTGLDLAREIRGVRSDLPVVLCSGFAEQRHVDAAGEAGVREILHKPLSVDDLGSAIRRAVTS